MGLKTSPCVVTQAMFCGCMQVGRRVGALASHTRRLEMVRFHFGSILVLKMSVGIQG